MENYFTQTVVIVPEQTDTQGNLTPSALLYLCQEAAGGHCRLLGVDWDTLSKRGMFWALIRTHVEINRLPRAEESVRIETWPMPTTRTAFPRATVAYDAQGNLLFRSTALWVLMNTATRAMILPGKSGVNLQGIVRGNELAAPGSLTPFLAENILDRRVTSRELDRNAHMNNTHYIQWACCVLGEAFLRNHPCKGFTLCYLSEATLHQDIRLCWQLDKENCLHVEATRQKSDGSDGRERVFAARVSY
jgi:acyl-ACP thioesterase